MSERKERYEREKHRYELEGELEALLNRRELLVRGGAGLAVIGGFSSFLAACGGDDEEATPTTTAAEEEGWTAAKITAKYGSTTFGDSWHTPLLAILADRSTGGKACASAFGQKYRGISADLNSVKQISDVQTAVTSGMKAINTVPLEAPNVDAIYRACKESGALFTTSYNNPAWKTPIDYGPEYITYFAPDDRGTGRLMAEKLVEHLNGEGRIVHLEGLAGATANVLRSAGVDEVLEKNPNVKIAARINTNWSTDDAQKKMQNLLSSVSQIDGVIGQDDDIGIGAYNAIRVGGKEIPVVSNDGIQQAFELTKDSFYLGTVNAFSHWTGAYTLVRLFDALNGWKPEPAETMMFWQTSWVDESRAGNYLDGFFGSKLPYDFVKMSRVLYPDDWDTQQQLRPMDPDYLWSGEKKPSGYQLPEGLDSGARDEIESLYDEHWKARTFT